MFGLNYCITQGMVVICIRLIYIALLIDFFFISVFRVPVSGVFAEKTT